MNQLDIKATGCVPLKSPRLRIASPRSCECCHGSSDAGMEEHYLAAGAKVVLCPICHIGLHLDIAGKEKAGVMIWLPELEQAALNGLVTTIFILLLNKEWDDKDGESRTRIKTLYSTLESRKHPIDAFFGGANDLFEGSSPLFFAQQMASAEAKLGRGTSRSVMYERLEGVRFLAYPGPFNEYIRGAGRVLESQIPPKKWKSLVKIPSDIADGVGEILSTDDATQ